MYPPDKQYLLLIDFSNRFNSIDRSTLFHEVRAHTPGIAAWMECSYRAQPLLHLSGHTLYSCSGVQQGDPLGPMGFTLALHPVLSRIQHEVPSLLLNCWHLYDGTLGGSLDHRNSCNPAIPSTWVYITITILYNSQGTLMLVKNYSQ